MKLDQLEAKTKAATPGPWEPTQGGVHESKRQTVVVLDPSCASHNKQFIAAANPATVLRLIGLLRECMLWLPPKCNVEGCSICALLNKIEGDL